MPHKCPKAKKAYMKEYYKKIEKNTCLKEGTRNGITCKGWK